MRHMPHDGASAPADSSPFAGRGRHDLPERRSAVLPAIGERCLYLCVARRRDLQVFLDSCLAGGVDLVQLRDKTGTDREIMAAAMAARDVCHFHGVPFIVNDRPDLAIACGADGVHVGQEDVPPEVARQIVGDAGILGRSTHAPVELTVSGSEPVDYISVGPVVATPTKAGRDGTGLDYVTYASRNAAHPWFVTGGVTPEAIPRLWEAGARRFVVVRYRARAGST